LELKDRNIIKNKLLQYKKNQMETNESQIINLINIVCTPFSLLGAFYMIIAYFKSCSRSFSSRLVFCLAISDLLLSIVSLLEIISPNDENCTVLGFLRVSGIYSNMLWTTQVLFVLYIQFVHEYAGVQKTFPYIVASNIILSITPCALTVYDMYFDGPLSFQSVDGECFISPQTSYVYVLIIPFAVLLTFCCYMTIKVWLVFKEQTTTLANVDYKTLFMYPAVLFLLDVPISVDYAINHQFLPLSHFSMVLFKSLGLINALQFRKASNAKEGLMKASQSDVILRTLSQDGDSSYM